MKEQTNETKLATVAAVPPSKQAGEARDPWWWVERCVWTERMLTRLTSREPANCPTWAAVLGGGPRMDADNRMITNPLTGEPDAGNPPVRFGGRGKVNPLSLPLSAFPHPTLITPRQCWSWPGTFAKSKHHNSEASAFAGNQLSLNYERTIESRF